MFVQIGLHRQWLSTSAHRTIKLCEDPVKNWTRLEEIQINDNKGTPEKTLMPIHSATDSTVILIVRWIRSVNSGLEIPQVT